MEWNFLLQDEEGRAIGAVNKDWQGIGKEVNFVLAIEPHPTAVIHRCQPIPGAFQPGQAPLEYIPKGPDSGQCYQHRLRLFQPPFPWRVGRSICNRSHHSRGDWLPFWFFGSGHPTPAPAPVDPNPTPTMQEPVTDNPFGDMEVQEGNDTYWTFENATQGEGEGITSGVINVIKGIFTDE